MRLEKFAACVGIAPLLMGAAEPVRLQPSSSGSSTMPRIAAE